MNLLFGLAVATISAALAPMAMSQTTLDTVDQLQQAGASFVQGSDLAGLLVGHTWRSTYGTSGELSFSADRTFTGTVVVSENSQAWGVFGDWSIDDRGQLWITWKHQGGRANKPFFRSWYRLGESFYAGGPPERPTSKVWVQERVR